MYVGIDIGGTKILVAASPTGQRMTKSLKIETPKDSKKAIKAMSELARHVAGNQPIASVGVACPGTINHTKGIVHFSDNLGWHELQLKNALEKELQVNVALDNDAACGGLAEVKLGAAQGFRRALYLTISTGIGGSLIIDGQAYHGLEHNVEPGHITIKKDGPTCSCGAKGHFEALASGRAIKRDFGKYGYEIKDAKTWDKIAINFAAGVASLIAAYAPDIVVFAGGVSVHYARFQRQLKRHLGEFYAFDLPQIRQAKYVETAPVLGALLLASQAEHLLL